MRTYRMQLSEEVEINNSTVPNVFNIQHDQAVVCSVHLGSVEVEAGDVNTAIDKARMKAADAGFECVGVSDIELIAGGFNNAV